MRLAITRRQPDVITIDEANLDGEVSMKTLGVDHALELKHDNSSVADGYGPFHYVLLKETVKVEYIIREVKLSSSLAVEETAVQFVDVWDESIETIESANPI